MPYISQAVTDLGITGGAHDALVAGLGATIGDALGGTAGAAGAVNEVTNNYLTSQQWRNFATEMQQCKARSCTLQEQQAIRESFQQLSNQQNVALANCDAVGNCETLGAEVTSGTRTMLELAADGRLPGGGAVANDLGQYTGQRLASDPAYREQVNHSIAVLDNCNAHPDQCTQQAIKAAALVVLPLLGSAGVPLTAEALVAGGTIGAGANIAGQAYARANTPVSQRQPIAWGDATASVIVAGYTGALTYGAAFIPSLFVNTGGAVVTSAASSDPSAAGGNIASAAFGTAIGYPLGAAVQGGLNGYFNHWARPMWQDMGQTIQRWIGCPSPVPGMFGAGVGSIGQEAGNAIVNPPPLTPTNPTRGGR